MVAYYFIDSDGTENVSNVYPVRHPNGFWTAEERYVDSSGNNSVRDSLVEIPRGSIELLFGKKITFMDSPIKVTWNTL